MIQVEIVFNLTWLILEYDKSLDKSVFLISPMQMDCDVIISNRFYIHLGLDECHPQKIPMMSSSIQSTTRKWRKEGMSFLGIDCPINL
jgi:hypothetical protein